MQPAAGITLGPSINHTRKGANRDKQRRHGDLKKPVLVTCRLRPQNQMGCTDFKAARQAATPAAKPESRMITKVTKIKLSIAADRHSPEFSIKLFD
jgi:hypothetical protein